MAFIQDIFYSKVVPHSQDDLLDLFLNWIRKTFLFAEENNFDHVELIIESPLMNSDENCSKLVKIIKEHNVPFNFHAPFVSNNIIDFDYHVRRASINEYIEFLENVNKHDLVPRNITIHPGIINEYLFSIVSKLSEGLLADALDSIKKVGWREGVNVCVENMPIMNRFFGKLDEIKSITSLDAFKGFKMTLDTSHLYTCEGSGAFVKFLEKFSDLITNVHLVDNNTRHKDPHLPLGKGKIDLEGFLVALKDAGYDGDLTIEHPDGDAVLKSRDFIRRYL
ncbi:MAG: sugar phosphate isomerase/epimerase family protein [Promethearchaeota archaeon]